MIRVITLIAIGNIKIHIDNKIMSLGFKFLFTISNIRLMKRIINMEILRNIKSKWELVVIVSVK